MNVFVRSAAHGRTDRALRIGSAVAGLCAGLTGCDSENSLPKLQVYEVKEVIALFPRA
jgi:hypothetical protein